MSASTRPEALQPAMRSRLRRAMPPLSAALAAGMATPASAHVKWFAPYDVTHAPAPLAEVFSLPFLLMGVGVASMISVGFLLDRLVVRSGRAMDCRPRWPDAEEGVIRAGIGAFFVALFAMGGVILTPELRTDATWPAWLQLGIAATMLWPRSCVLGAAGILVLYAYGVMSYGVFHLADYPMFLGIAAYLALSSKRSERLRAMRMPILCCSLCITLMWGAVEKWAYPQWTFPLLETHPHLTLGLPHATFMIAAGFVEFALAFYIMTGLGLMRLSIIALGFFFFAAIPDFGRLDAIGHLPIIASLAALFLHGPTALHRRLHDARRNLLAESRRGGTAFATAVCLLVAAYYGVQSAEHGHGRPTMAAIAATPQ
jgi:hypothetical protein